ncbi:ATP-binding protein [Maridesulfovibrio sp.]|uniref:AAA family ATPase n=1 Tax=Maridesulfovibrio sp. TaxID=2795000 RepID=UPI002A186BD2|nr:ATP-binding protein [Maridesulfovibrio sp.]
MLLEFSVANFRSIGEEQTLYMQPAFKSKDEDHNILETGIRREPQALPVVAILGANASGKSTFLEALLYLAHIIDESGSRKKDMNYSDQSFKLNSEYKKNPTSFKIKFIAPDGALYNYYLSLFPEKISREKLTKRANVKYAKETILIERIEQKINLHNSIHNKKSFLNLWNAEINKQETALSFLANKGDVEIFDVIMLWFNRLLYILPTKLPESATAKLLHNNIFDNSLVIDFLKSADINIAGVEIKKNEFEVPSEVHSEINALIAKKLESIAPVEVETKISNSNQYNINFAHTTTQGKKIFFNIKDESEGTKSVFAFYAPLEATLAQGSILIVDELDNSLHPYLVRKIIQLFTDKKTNPKGAQLIFTTHDVTVMDKSLLRPDEIYFTEKDKETFETKLYSLAEFKGMGSVSKNDRGEKLYKDYLNGRFGAVPDVDWEVGI